MAVANLGLVERVVDAAEHCEDKGSRFAGSRL